MSTIPDITLNRRTALLVKVVTAYTLTEDMPASTKRSLVAHVRGLRLLAEASEYKAVAECVTALRSTITDGIDESVVDWPEILVRHCDSVLRAVK